MIGTAQHTYLRDGIAGCGEHTEIAAGRWTSVPDDLHCFVGLDIGNFTSIASGCKIVSGQHPPIEHPEVLANFPFDDWDEWRGLGYPASKKGGYVSIGHDVWIGQDVHILDGVTIGDGAIVGACSVVAKDVEPYSVVVGNPAMHKHYRCPVDLIPYFQSIRWWDWDDETIRVNMRWLAGETPVA